MQLNHKNIWQQGGGDGDRIYCDICFKYGVILNGPGYAGEFSEKSNKQLMADGISSKKITDLRRFCKEMKDGDIVVLRVGTKEIYGVGVIVGDYTWNNIFSDIDGWDMQHTRRVNWLWNQDKPKAFPLYTLKQGDTTQTLDSQEVVDWIKTLSLDFALPAQLPILPQEDEVEIKLESIAEFLYDKGTSGNSIERLINVIDDLHMIAKWYKKQDSPSEFETESYLIIPLLRALGWTPQKMAIEWNKVDIALFQKLPRTDENLVAVVEAKRKGNSCLTAFSQAERYSQNKKNCNRLVVTDGLRYGVFLKNKQGTYKLHAYMNLTELKDEYVVYECKGINEALWAMTPDWNEA